MRDFLNSDRGRPIIIVLACAAVGILGWMLLGRLWGAGAAAATGDRVFIDATNGRSFRYSLNVGDRVPVVSPHSGERTGFEAEACYWTADGLRKDEPTWVLPADRVDPQAPPTFCPDCGRLVRQNNPSPEDGVKAPPTREEYAQRNAPSRREPPAAGRRRGRGDAGPAEAQLSSYDHADPRGDGAR